MEGRATATVDPISHWYIIMSTIFPRFASVVAVYIIGGFLYQRLVVGAKGMEQFPHITFWQDLGNLVAVSIKRHLYSAIKSSVCYLQDLFQMLHPHTSCSTLKIDHLCYSKNLVVVNLLKKTK